MGSVIAVSGAVGGIGASTLAYAIASQVPQSSVLIDARTSGVPLELLIGGEAEPGTRWHQIHISTPDIDPETVLAALPEWNGVRFLSSNAQGVVHQPAFLHIVSVLREHCQFVVIDIGARSELLEALQPDLHVLAVPNTIYGLGAAVASLRQNTELVVTRSHLEDFRPDELARYLQQPSLGTIEIERTVWLALRTRSALPTNTTVMKTADRIIMRLADAA